MEPNCPSQPPLLRIATQPPTPPCANPPTPLSVPTPTPSAVGAADLSRVVYEPHISRPIEGLGGVRRELLEAMSAGAANCRRADSIKYIYNQQVFEYGEDCGEMGTAHGIRELARASSNEMRQIREGRVPEFETKAGCGLKRSHWIRVCEDESECSYRVNTFKKRRRGPHHSSVISDTPCLGKLNLTKALPEPFHNQFGESNNCSWPAASNCRCCSGVGSCGDPMPFHAENALLWFASMR